jgi:hypothetical protein
VYVHVCMYLCVCVCVCVSHALVTGGGTRTFRRAASSHTSADCGHSSHPCAMICRAAASLPATSSNRAAAIQPSTHTHTHRHTHTHTHTRASSAQGISLRTLQLVHRRTPPHVQRPNRRQQQETTQAIKARPGACLGLVDVTLLSSSRAFFISLQGRPDPPHLTTQTHRAATTCTLCRHCSSPRPPRKEAWVSLSLSQARTQSLRRS